MLYHESVEFKLLDTVKLFCADQFPNCLVVLHASVFFHDETFIVDRLDENEARRELCTNPKAKHMCEVTPDYALFRKEDVLGIRQRKGNTNGEEVFIAPDSIEFEKLVGSSAPIPYVAWEKFLLSVPKGKKMVVMLRDQTFPVAVVDHKGKSDLNLQAQRRKVV